MGHAVEITDTGVETEVHRFDDKESAERYVTRARRFTFDKHETWGMSRGIDFYNGGPGERAAIREDSREGWDGWKAVFWETDK